MLTDADRKILSIVFPYDDEEPAHPEDVGRPSCSSPRSSMVVDQAPAVLGRPGRESDRELLEQMRQDLAELRHQVEALTVALGAQPPVAPH